MSFPSTERVDWDELNDYVDDDYDDDVPGRSPELMLGGEL